MVNPRFVSSKQTTTKQFFCHLCMNPTALEIKPPANADHMHWDFGRPSDTWKLSGIIYSTLTVETCKLNTFTISDTFTPQFSKPVFHSSSWQLVHCIRIGLPDVRQKEDMSSFLKSCPPSGRHLALYGKMSGFSQSLTCPHCWLQWHNIISIV